MPIDLFNIRRSEALITCKKMSEFYQELSKLYQNYGMSLESNRGRRNILMSAPMEHFLAKTLMESGLYKTVTSDGRTGCADLVVVNMLDQEIEVECKLTSPQQSSGAITFQTDHDTLEKKGTMDYVYIVADETFDGFVVLHFQNLTIEEFRDLSPGARGKVQMFKHKGMKKATVLVGKAISSIDTKKVKREKDCKNSILEISGNVSGWKKKLETIPKTRKYDKQLLEKKIQSGLTNIDKVLNKLQEDLRIIDNSKARYSFEFESLEQK